MKWNPKANLQHGYKRIITKFAWLPVEVSKYDDESETIVVWLETYHKYQVWSPGFRGDESSNWRTERLVALYSNS